MRVLGIETSCDETAVSLVGQDKILSESISSQIKIHSKYGGVVPEIASREHLKKINILLENCLDKINLKFNQIDGIAVTSHPGLEGSLLVGLTVARTLSFLLNLPLIEIDHLEAHLFAHRFKNPGPPPGIGLIISGGHTRLLHITKWGKYKILGRTRDDAVGECFDKVASILGLSYPGGPAIEKIAKKGDCSKFSFPVSNLGESLDFSYSGLKTAVLYKIKYDLKSKINDKQKRNIACSFQKAAFEPLIKNSIKAARRYQSNWIFVTGGVAANKYLRKLFIDRGKREDIKVVFPPVRLCTDNASVVAACGQFYLKRDIEP